MPSLSEKVAMVTGSSRGIGKAIAERFGREGASVIVNYSRSEKEAEDVVASIESTGGVALAVKADMAITEEISFLFDSAIERFGHVDIFVNNAARFVFSSISETSEEDFDKVFGLNARGSFFAMQKAARILPDGGRIISISTGATTLGMPFFGAYLGSKAALEEFGMVLANELGPRQITVNTVLAGATETKMFDDIFEFWPPEVREMLIQRTPLGRVGTPQDIGDVVAFLASDDARWITGQSIRVDGGLR